MAQQEKGAYKRSTVTKMLIAEAVRTTHALPKPEGQYEAQTYLSPTGRVVAKVMVCGTAVENEDVGKEQSLWRLRIADPSGSIQIYAGMYQPEAAQVITQLQIPQFVAVVGKLNVYEPEEGNQIVSIRPDSVTILNGKQRDDFILDAALSTLRSVRATTDEKMKEVAAIYGEKDGKDAYIFVGRQVIEDISKDRNIYKAGEDKAQEDKQGATAPAQPPNTNVSKPAPASPSPSSVPPLDHGADQKTSPAYPKGAAKAAKKKDETKSGKAIESSIQTVQEVVYGILKAKGTVKYEDLEGLLKEKGVNPGMVDWSSAVNRLMQEGYCIEPKLGVLRVVT